MIGRSCLGLLASLGLASCTPAPPRLLVAHPSGVQVLFLSKKAYPSAPGTHAAIAAWPVDRTEHALTQVIRIDGEETLHRHENHDLVVFLVEGRGIMRLGGDTFRLEAGDAVLIRRGTSHAFRNTSPRGSLALAVSVPPASPADRVDEP